MSTVSAGRANYIKPTSITLLRIDPLPNLPPSIDPLERLFQYTKAVSLVASTADDPSKFRADITTAQTHDRMVKSTIHPVPRGEQVSDHVIKLPTILNFTGMITDTPLIPWSGDLAIPFTPNRVHEQIRQLDEFYAREEPLFVASSLRSYPSMLIERFRLTRSTSSGGSATIQLMLKEIRFTTEIRARPIPESLVAQLGSEPAEIANPSGEFLD